MKQNIGLIEKKLFDDVYRKRQQVTKSLVDNMTRLPRRVENKQNYWSVL